MAEDNPSGSDGSDNPSPKPIADAVDIICKKYEVAQGNRAEHDRETLVWARRTGIGVAVYTVLTFVIAIVAIWGTYIAYTTQKLQNRAFVFKRQIDLVPTFDNTGKIAQWRIAPLWENSGATPTKSLKIVMDCPAGSFDFSGRPIKCPISDFLSARPYYSRFLGPHQASHDEGSCDAKTPAEIAVIPDHRFFMWGYARYTDVFGDEHKTRFCQGVILSGEATMAGSLNVESVIADGGNCTDEICDEQDLEVRHQTK
jgi:hypothetical protein